jgi:hypothetical protein
MKLILKPIERDWLNATTGGIDDKFSSLKTLEGKDK